MACGQGLRSLLRGPAAQARHPAQVQDPLAGVEILAGEIGDGETVRIGAERGSLTINGAPIGGAQANMESDANGTIVTFPKGSIN